jgi:hypothetical protein
VRGLPIWHILNHGIHYAIGSVFLPPQIISVAHYFKLGVIIIRRSNFLLNLYAMYLRTESSLLVSKEHKSHTLIIIHLQEYIALKYYSYYFTLCHLPIILNHHIVYFMHLIYVNFLYFVTFRRGYRWNKSIMYYDLRSEINIGDFVLT